MKHFLYLDTSRITSYLAQVNNGNIISRQTSATKKTDESTIDPSDKTSYSARGSVGLLHTLLGANLDFETHSFETAFLQSSSATEMAQYVVHDDMLNQMIHHMGGECAIASDPTFRRYCMLEDAFRYLDINWLTDFWEKFALFYDKQPDSALNRQQRRDTERKGENRSVRDGVAMPQSAKEMFKSMEVALPSTRLLYSNRVLCFLKDEFLRENTATFLLHCNNPLVLFGYVGNQVLERAPVSADFLGRPQEIPHVILNVLVNFKIPVFDGMPIIDPVAIYVNEDDPTSHQSDA